MKNFHAVVALAILAGSVGSVSAQPAEPFPDRPLRYIVPFPPGGSTDIVARIMADALTRQLGQQVVIDNRAGAGGTVGAEIAARTTPDGYTMFACNIASLAVSPALYARLGYDPIADFSPIGLIGSNPNALAVFPEVPAKTVAEFIAHAKSRPGKMNYSSAGVGTSPQMSMEMFKMATGVDIVHVAYKGGGPALVGLMGGEVQAMFATVPSLITAIRSERVRVLAVTSTTRFPDLPDTPTLVESGLKGFEVISWQGLCTPTGVPQAALARVVAALTAALDAPETRKLLADQSIQPTPLITEKYGEFIRSEQAKWSKLVKQLGIKPR